MNFIKAVQFRFKRAVIPCSMVLIPFQIYCQETFPKNDISDTREKAMAFTHATVVVDPATKLENATLLIRNGLVESVTNNNEVPPGYSEINLEDRYIYPSFIDMFSTYGQPVVKKPPSANPYVKKEQVQPNTKGAYNANEAIKSFFNSSDHFTADIKSAKSYREQGFGVVSSIRPDGIARGTSCLVLLGEGGENQMMVQAKTASHYSFDKGSSSQDFPISPMGAIALLRQTFHDAEWYNAQTTKPFVDLALEAIGQHQDLPGIFEANGWMTALRAHKIGQEFNVGFIIKGGGDEYQRIEEVKEMNAPLIVPINFPAPYDVSDPYTIGKISLTDLKHWELAPANPARLEENGINFAITSYPDASRGEFLENLRKSVALGLSPQKALSGLTTVPASLLRVSQTVGTLQKGRLANFLVTNGDIFDETTLILENWIKGEQFRINQLPDPSIAGQYQLSVGDSTFVLTIEAGNGKHNASIKATDSTSQKVVFRLNGKMTTLQFEDDQKNHYSLGGWFSDSQGTPAIEGTGTLNYGKPGHWHANRIESKDSIVADTVKNRDYAPGGLGKVIFPFTAYGRPEKVQPEDILIKNATVWTNEAPGVLEGTDVLIRNGKIADVGKNLNAPSARIIDGSNRHLTPGIIDEHSHIAISAVNDIATNSGMIRMEDVLDPEDISIYRALAGGVVAAQILHGSANPIGGQSAIIKLKWGENPDGLKIAGAAPFIKFALGENPKRSKSAPSVRFPRSLMGLEQFYTNAFSEALGYSEAWEKFNNTDKKKKNGTVKPRVDLLDEAMLEVVQGKRFISCHSYQEKEMLMLMDVADRFGFTINTFTHALEGYRIADKMLQHGVGGSTFSDKWNFKWETRNAIPYNATIMNREGVVTAVNSDSRETIRHLNHEAAKSIKYGGMDDEDALKLITLNPAKLLHLDQTMGSIKTGKSADLVLWSGPPLSIYARPEKTIIEGGVYFDIERDAALRNEIQQERSRIIKLIGSGANQTAGPESKISTVKPEFDCSYLGIKE